MSAQPMPKNTRKHSTNSHYLKKEDVRIRQHSKESLSVEDKAALEEIMKGNAEITRHSGEEYLKKIRAALNEST